MDLKWNDSYSVRISEIDVQHKILFGLINKLHTSIRTAEAEIIVPEVINELVKYVNIHFSLEEEYMEKANYPDLSKHKMEHADMRKEIERRADKLLGDDIAFTDMIELYLFLQEWMNKHILNSDKQYIPYLKEFQDVKTP